jgi:hypothetical protein
LKENETLKAGLEQSKPLQSIRGQISQLEKLKMVVAELNAREKAHEQRDWLKVTLLKTELESEKIKV